MGIGPEGENGSQIKANTQGSFASVNSTSEIVRRHSQPRDSKNRSSGNPEFADISLPDM
jgi:hypothetical protein